MNRLLIIDSGATKADWSLMQDGALESEFKTPGIPPFFMSDEEISAQLAVIAAQTCDTIDGIFFYGTGCKAESSRKRLHAAFSQAFPSAHTIEVETDVLGAARALCGHKPGIACILGTGSNSVWYNGQEVVQNSGGYGYILGDEGSGAVLGKELIIAWLNGELPPDLIPAFDETFGISKDVVIERVYRGETPSRYLAGFVPFLSKNIQSTFVQELLQRQFRLFIRRCVLPYSEAQHLPVHFTGSVAYHFRSVLEGVLSEAGLQSGLFLAAPMEGLRRFHGAR
jgi:N-acetylglucosamine kinase-like BadF-type ATPase